ncbi:hypothetical protein FQA39_LY01523 [Lamprigera yunnana]|nr:hypothetical protein FQA39_LY01523 [Lamprigera yunnana]
MLLSVTPYIDVTFSSSSDDTNPFSNDDSIKDPHYVAIEVSSSSNCENSSDNNTLSPLKYDTDPFSDGDSSKEAHYVAYGVFSFSERENVPTVNKSTNYNEIDASRTSPLINLDYTKRVSIIFNPVVVLVSNEAP